ncbi:LytR/AlgR family response regulator transcription factor [Arsenicibacter rosenii]|nr:LytTR family DNA-binding domain-containing protein [Arsenicibacter rosenii]
MAVFTAILVDDEQPSLDALMAKLGFVASDIEILGRYCVAQEALLAVERLQPDLIFLDIEMPGMDGFTFQERVRAYGAEIIFTTAYQQYAIPALRAYAFDFLLKPVDEDELAGALGRFRQKRREQRQQVSDQKQNQSPASLQKIAVPSARGMLFVPLADVVYLEAHKNYTIFHLTGKRQLVATRTLKEYELLLDTQGFFRIHHAAVINLQHLTEYIRGEGGSVILSDGSEVEVARRRKQEFLARLG